MLMKNKLFLTAFLLAVCMTSQGSVINSFTKASVNMSEEEAEKPTHFILCLKDGRQVGFLLEHTPRVVNGDGFITVECQNEKIEYPFADIDRYTMGIDNSQSAIINAEKDKRGVFSNAFGKIVMNGFKPGAKIIVSNINGAMVSSSQINSHGYGEIDLSTYPNGIYIVNADNQNFKFIKK